MLISEQKNGFGYEQYLRNKLEDRLYEEYLLNNTSLKGFGCYRTHYSQKEFLYIHDDDFPKDIVREVMSEKPEYLDYWPSLKAWLNQ